jgi:hypothetical protein
MGALVRARVPLVLPTLHGVAFRITVLGGQCVVAGGFRLLRVTRHMVPGREAAPRARIFLLPSIPCFFRPRRGVLSEFGVLQPLSFINVMSSLVYNLSILSIPSPSAGRPPSCASSISAPRVRREFLRHHPSSEPTSPSRLGHSRQPVAFRPVARASC